MIIGFPEQTKELNQAEIEIAKDLIMRLKRFNVGKKNVITGDKITAYYNRHGHQIKGPRLRKIINFIRTHQLVKNLIANSDGYYISNDSKEIDDYILSLNQRINSIIQVRNSFTK